MYVDKIMAYVDAPFIKILPTAVRKSDRRPRNKKIEKNYESDWRSLFENCLYYGSGILKFNTKPKTMKKHLLFLFALLCVGFACGCSDDDEKAPDSVFLYSTSTPAGNPEPAEGGVRSVTIFTTCAWTATSQASWITVSPASGSEKGIHAVHLTFAAND